jgi:hypothetical protein
MIAYGVICTPCTIRVRDEGNSALCGCWESDGPHFHDAAPIAVDLDGRIVILWSCALCGMITNSRNAILARDCRFGQDPRVLIPVEEVDIVELAEGELIQ